MDAGPPRASDLSPGSREPAHSGSRERKPHVLLVYTSNVRAQYIRHVLAASAMPRGSVLRNRYDRRWVDREVWADWHAGALVGERVLVCYLEGIDGHAVNVHAAPVRWGVVQASKAYGYYGVLDVELDALAGGLQLSDLVDGVTNAGIVRPGPHEGSLVIRAPLRKPLEHELDGDDVGRWQDTVDRLSRFRTLREASFIYLDGLCTRHGDRRILPRLGRYGIHPGVLYEAVMYGISPEIRPDAHRYRVHADEDIFEILDHEEFGLGYRFDVIRVPLRVRAKRARWCQVRFVPFAGTIGPEVELQIEVRDRWMLNGLSVAAPGLAAATAASAGILPHEVPLWVRASILLSGSAALAAANRLGRNA